jgi:hypothetical protein
MPRNSSFGDRETENRGRLAAFDALERGDQRAEKLDIQSARAAFDMATKQQQLEMQAQSLTQRTQAANDRDMLAEKALDAKLAAQALREMESDRKITDGINYFADAATLDPSADDFDAKFSALKMKTLRASDNDDVKKHTDYILGQRQKFMDAQLTARTAAQQLAEARRLAAGGGLKLDKVTGGPATFTAPKEPETTVSVTEGTDELTNRPFKNTRTTTSGTVDQMKATTPTAPQSGKDFLNSLGIKPKLPKLKTVPGTGGALEG